MEFRSREQKAIASRVRLAIHGTLMNSSIPLSLPPGEAKCRTSVNPEVISNTISYMVPVWCPTKSKNEFSAVSGKKSKENKIKIDISRSSDELRCWHRKCQVH